jgi:hypothetical protein
LEEEKRATKEVKDGRVQEHREEMLGRQVLEEVEDWVDVPFYSGTKDTKYFSIAETYWIVKSMVG